VQLECAIVHQHGAVPEALKRGRNRLLTAAGLRTSPRNRLPPALGLLSPQSLPGIGVLVEELGHGDIRFFTRGQDGCCDTRLRARDQKLPCIR
jgi:hypothetical protein